MYLLHRHHGVAGVDAFDMLKLYLPKRRYELKPRGITIRRWWTKLSLLPLSANGRMESLICTIWKWNTLRWARPLTGGLSEGWASNALTVDSYDMAAAVLAGFPYQVRTMACLMFAANGGQLMKSTNIEALIMAVNTYGDARPPIRS